MAQLSPRSQQLNPSCYPPYPPPPIPWAARTSGQRAGWERQLCRPLACCRGLVGTTTVWGGGGVGGELGGGTWLPGAVHSYIPFNFLLPGLLTFMFKGMFLLIFQCSVLDTGTWTLGTAQLEVPLSITVPAPGPLRPLISLPAKPFFSFHWLLPGHMGKSLSSSNQQTNLFLTSSLIPLCPLS